MSQFGLTIVMAFGVLITAASIWGLIAPMTLLVTVRSVAGRSWGLAFAVGIRLVLGVVLIVSAPASRLPHVFATLGWITIIAAVGLPLFGMQRVGRLIGWFEQRGPGFVRIWLLMGLVFGGALIYGSV